MEICERIDIPNFNAGWKIMTKTDRISKYIKEKPLVFPLD